MNTLSLSSALLDKIAGVIADELQVRHAQVSATIELLDGGATVPFIARYRKEVTGGLDDTQLRNLSERLIYLRELEERRAVILQSITEQGKLTAELERAIQAGATKQQLEDLYLPYKPKRRTRAQIAREAGLEPLALSLWQDPSQEPHTLATLYLNPEANIHDAKAALDGARDILAELFAENADLLGKLRTYLWNLGWLSAQVLPDKAEEGEKFRDYFAFAETIKTVPSHRALALFRARNLGVLQIRLDLEETLAAQVPHPCVTRIAEQMNVVNRQRPADKFLQDCCVWAWRVKIHPALETELLTQLREAAENEAIQVFGRNLKDLLLAAPAGPKAVLGLDPGIRTGVKLAVVDKTGKVLETGVIYPHEPRNDWQGAQKTLAALIVKHQVELVAVGNGTASRETDKLVGELLKCFPDMQLQKVVVSEAGASVYSASEVAAQEFPDLDVSLRGAVSIARRLQDPLAELVKIDPKSIGVGQYQHDVNQRELARQLDAIVEDCVNAVGVDVNTASSALLARVSGLNSILAKNIVNYRDQNGAFASRAALKAVPRLGEKTFEQAAGFLRVNNGSNPLDCSAVHPEAYPLVERILARLGKEIHAVMGQTALLRSLMAQDFTDEKFGLPTVRDILTELDKPGRDPRPEFKTAQFREGVETMKDLQPGMVLEGVVTNVANFGAFIDIGVHQDGLVHISALAHKFVKNPHEVVKAGDLVKVKVLEIDIKRQRIGLTMRLDDAPGADRSISARNFSDRGAHPHAKSPAQRQPVSGGRLPEQHPGALAAAFAKLKK